MKFKVSNVKSLIKIMVLCLFLGSVISVVPVGILTANAFSDVSCMTDAEFFGVWNGSTWTTVGKINYSYNSGLTAVETYVKNGDYSGAGSALLSYYRNRTSRTVVPYSSTVRDTASADLYCDNILTGYGETYAGEFTMNNTPQTVSINVNSAVSSQYETGKICFVLMARYKEGSAVNINSKEASSGKPVLEMVVNGQTVTINAEKDTYIRPGTYGDTNYGINTYMEIKDWGVPFDDYCRRGYIQFDLSSLASAPTSSVLKLYGNNISGTGDKKIIIFNSGDTTWGETSLTWNNTKSSTFSWQGQTSGSDWNLPSSGADSQWINAITRFGFLPKIIYEYNVTSDEDYAYNALRLMLDFIQDKDSTPNYYRSLDTGLRAYSWVTAYDYLIDSNSMDANASTAILKYMWQMANVLGDPESECPFSSDITDWTQWNSATYHPFSNWSIIENKGLYSIAVYFPELLDAGSWKTLADTRYSEQMTNELFYDDTSYVEPSSMYTAINIDNYYQIKDFASINNQSMTSSFDDGLKNLAKFVMDYSLPNGYDPQYGDSDYISNRTRVLNVGNIYNDTNLKFFGTAGASGTEPSYESVIYPDLQRIAIMRTGWSANDLFMHINNGSGNGSHTHPDNLSLIAYAYNKRLLIDPGRKDYNYSDSITSWIRGATDAHNTIEVADAAQPLMHTGVTENWSTNSRFDFFEGSSTAYSGTKHTRSVLLVKPGYWIVSDIVLAGTASRKFEQTWHMLPDAAPTIDASTDKVKTNNSGEANLQIIPADPQDITASLADGYYSSGYLISSNAKYASYVKNTAGDITFDTVLYPTTDNDTTRDVRVTRLTTSPSVDKKIATALKIELNYGNNGDIGYYYMSHEALPATARSFEAYNFDGKLAYVVKDYNGNRKSALIKSGTTLKESTTNLISYSQVIGDMSIEWSGNTLDISGSLLEQETNIGSAIAIYAPSASAVTLNGSSISYTKSGDYIYAVKQQPAPTPAPPTPTPTPVPGIVNDNFNGNTTGDTPSDWITTLNNGTVTIAEDPSSTDKSVKVDKTSSTGETKAQKTFISQSGVVTVEAKIKADENTGGKCAPYVYSSGGGTAATIAFSDGYIKANVGGTWQNVQAFSPDTWYTIMLVLNTDTDKFDLYVDGIKKLSQADMRTAVSDIANISFYIGESQTGTFNFDNVKIWGSNIVNDNFNGETTGNVPTGWNTTLSNGTVTIAEDPSSSDKSVKVDKTGFSGETKAEKTFTKKSGIITIEERIKTTSVSNVKSLPYVYSSSGGVAVSMSFSSDGYIKANVGGTWQNVQTYSANTWYDIKLVLNTDTDKFDLFINGIIKLEQANMRDAVSDIAKIVHYIGEGQTGTFNLDNVKVTLSPIIAADDSFNGDTTGYAPLGWDTILNNGTVTIAEDPSSSDKSVKVDKTGSSGETKAQKTFISQSGVVTVEAKIKADENNGGKCAPYVYSSGGGAAATIVFSDGYIKAYVGGTWQNAQAFSPDTWYNIKLVLNTDTDKFDLYIDGIERLAQANLRTAVSDIAKVVFYVGEGQTGTFYFDDVKVYK